MFPTFRLPRLFAAVTAFILAAMAPATRLHAQQQERGILERINKPDLTLGYSPAQKKFDGSNAARTKSFTGRSYAFNKAAHVKAFRSRDFAESKSFRTRLFATGERDAAGRGDFAGRDRAFNSRAVPVREAGDAQKALPVRVAVAPGEQPRPFLGRGKHQSDLDDQSRNRPQMSIEEVRELLNKSR